MTAEMKRVMLSIPKELVREIDQVKQHQFRNTTQDEMYRCFIRRGLDALKAEPPPKPSAPIDIVFNTTANSE